MTKDYPTWALYIILVCGLAALFFGAWMTYRTMKVNGYGLRTEGTIVEYSSRTKNPQAAFGNGLIHTPTFSFITKEGVKFSLKSSVQEENKTYEIGEKVTISYDPGNPKNAHITGRNSWLGSTALLVFGLFGFLFCAIELNSRRL